jgi:non-ribosomal peptide synthase protein (TIGR01720 family)
MRMVWCDAPGGPPVLVWVVHHMAVDGVSWRLLLDDLAAAYTAGGGAGLGLKSTSFPQWAQSMARYATGAAVPGELEHWRAVLTSGAQVSLPVDHPDVLPTPGTGFVVDSVVDAALSVQETERLLRTVPQAWSASINEVLVLALGTALATWSGGPDVLVDLEGHGRETVDPDTDVSRTVGWFTSVYPVFVHTDPGVGAAERLAAVRDSLGRTPRQGIGFGALRYLGPDDVRAELAAYPVPWVSFNYLGQFDQSVSNDLFDGTVAVTRQAGVGPEAAVRVHAVEITARVVDSAFHVGITYAGGLFERASVRAVADGFVAELRTLLDGPATAAAPSTQDFPLADLSRRDFNALIKKRRGRR